MNRSVVAFYARECVVFLMIRRPPISTRFPYTRLFRSRAHVLARREVRLGRAAQQRRAVRAGQRLGRGDALPEVERALERSAEHTSELQSRQYLVCRLLLETKRSCRRRPSRRLP